MAANVSTVYLQVIDDVITKVRDDFVNSGAVDGVLTELQALWETKMMQCGAISGNIDRSSIPKPTGAMAPVHDLNVPYEGPIEEYETPTAGMLFPPTPIPTPMRTPTPLRTPGTAEQSYNILTGYSDFSPLNELRNGGGDGKGGRSSPYMQPPTSWMNQRPLGVDVNVSYVEGRDDAERGAPGQSSAQEFLLPSGKRKRDDYAPHLSSGGFMPQQDRSGDVTIEFFLSEENQTQKSLLNHGQVPPTNADVLPQQEGIHDEYDELFSFQGVANEDYNNTPENVEFRTPTPSIGTPKPTKNEAADDDEPPLNEDDDDEDDLDDLEQGEEETHTQHLVLAQFDKVTRTKSRWKCALKDGIMHLNNRDILFNMRIYSSRQMGSLIFSIGYRRVVFSRR